MFWRIFVINAALFVAGALLLANSPAQRAEEVTPREWTVLAVGFVLLLLVNLVLVRRTLAPLGKLTAHMRSVDLLRPGQRLQSTGAGWEIEQLTAAFNEMLERLEAERHDSSRRAIEAQEQERRRVALELHDEVGQTLTGVVLGLDGLAQEAPAQLRPHIEELQVVVRDGAEHVREIARGLRPESLEELGLRPALVGLLTTITDRTRLRVQHDIDHNLPALPAPAELVIYRVLQESITNVLRHARATVVDVALKSSDGQIELRVVDDGCGIDSRGAESGGGLRGMRERAVSVGGSLDIHTLAHGGTVVRLRIPVGGRAR